MALVPSDSSLNKPGSLFLHLSQDSHCFFIVFKLLQKFWLYCFFQSVVRKGEVHTVSVHLGKLVVSPVEVVVQEVIVELQHSQLGQLIYHDAYLKGSVYHDIVFAGFDLVCVTDLFEIFKIG